VNRLSHRVLASMAAFVASTAAVAVPQVPATVSLVASDGAPYDLAATAVDVLGAQAVFGVRGRDDGATNRGAVYVFRAVSGVWTQSQKLAPEIAIANEEFGHTVSLGGVTLAVGAPRSPREFAEAGGVWVYRSNGVSWDFAARIPSPSAQPGGLFGCAVDVDRDLGSEAMIVGARRESMDGVPCGRAYVFRRDAAGAWIAEGQLVPPAPATENDSFGQTVLLHGDWAFVGAPGEDSAGVNAGAVFVFRRVAGVWAFVQRIASPLAEDLGEFGCAIALEGTDLVVGAYREDGGATDAGRVHLFTLSGGSWGATTSLSSPTPAATGEFGCAVAAEAGAIAVGAQRESSSVALSGQTMLYRRVGATWISVARLSSQSPQVSEFAGSSLAMSGLQVVFGAPLRTVNGPYQGSAQLVDLSGDCDGDLVPDLAEIAAGTPDCNANRVPDPCDIEAGAVDADANGIPDACEIKPCPADLSGNGIVSAADLAILLDEWGTPGQVSGADLDGDGVVGAADISALLSAWGPCP
jgi:FG-GAP repeat